MTKTKNILRVVPFVTTIAIMIFIFMFSSQPSEQSAAVSRGITQHIVDIVSNVMKIPPEKKPEMVLSIHGIIRKIAHFMIYSALGFSAAAMFLSIKPKSERRFLMLYAVIFSCIYAVSDEFHQSFVSGRGPLVTDVLLDTCGAGFGGGIFLILLSLYLYMNKRKQGVLQ